MVFNMSLGTLYPRDRHLDEAETLKRIQMNAKGSVRLDLLGFVRFPKGHNGDAHSHPFWELIFIGTGTGNFRHGSGAFPCVGGEMVLIPPGETHRFAAEPDSPLDQLYMGFSFDFPIGDAGTAPRPRKLPNGPFADIIRAEMECVLACLLGGEAVETVRGRLLSVAGRMMGFLIPADGPASDADRVRNPPPISLAKELLRSDLKQRHSLPDLARRFCLSPQYFGELFKRETGMSVKEFQRECRMERAMSLLHEGRLSITEIAAEVGLHELAYFSRLFKRKFGKSPRLVRSQLAPLRNGRKAEHSPERHASLALTA